MTTVRVFGGACKFSTVIEARRDGHSVKVSIKSECDAVNNLSKEINVVKYEDIFPKTRNVFENIVYACAGKHLKHADCPVPCGIMKAILVEFGMQRGEPPRIEFE
ncbi:MAG: hypothetical protein OD814_000464 [Candidatus Alkanophagales archaeon MCA70_species_1]|nr:hypothetical protein [Candidatus Alkanophaga volatiphilum]